jgi:hypothetical protein
MATASAHETAGPPPRPPASLLERLRADPVRAPELLALAAAGRHGPAARDWVAQQRGSPDRLARRARRMHARYVRLSGGLTGIGGALTLVPDLVAAVWIQSRMVFFVAAAYGFDPTDRMRPAELLVLYDLYRDPAEARAALDGVGRPLAAAAVRRTLAGRTDETLVRRLARMALRRGASRLAGRVVPGFAMLVNAAGNERALRELAGRAIAFYRDGAGLPPSR